MLIINSLLILFFACVDVSDVKVEEETYPIISGLRLGESLYKTKQRIDSLEAYGKIKRTGKLSFSFTLPLISDSIEVGIYIDGLNLYHNKFYKLYISENFTGSWQSINTKCNELKELLSHKYTQVTVDSSFLISGFGENREWSMIHNIWTNGDLEVHMEYYIVDITGCPIDKDWNYYPFSKNLSNTDISNNDGNSSGRYVMVLELKYTLKNIENEKFHEEKFHEDSLKNIEIEKRKEKVDSLTQYL